MTFKFKEGKLTPALVEKVLENHTDEHMVKPKLVYISNATEIGTIYYKEELKALYEYCQSRKLLLFIDGARLGSALAAEDNDVTLFDMANYSDAFYIGGTKNGALLAKERVISIGFIELFRERLFFELAEHANQMAKLLNGGIERAGYCTLTKSTTNQIFPIFPNEVVEELKKQFDFSEWERIDDNQVAIRLVTSWATPRTEVEKFCEYLNELK